MDLEISELDEALQDQVTTDSSSSMVVDKGETELLVVECKRRVVKLFKRQLSLPLKDLESV